MARLSLLVCALLALSCDRAAEVSPETKGSAPAPSASFAGKPTSALVKREKVAALVDDLAAEKRVESSHVGVAGAPSNAFAKYQALVKAANADEIVALLQHESPIVRIYLAQHVAKELPARVHALVPLAGDTTTVETLEGCIGGGDLVGNRVREALCDSDVPQAGRALMAIHRAGGMFAAPALACAAATAPKPAGEIAVKVLRAGPLSPRQEAAYLDVLAVAGGQQGCALARARATHADPDVQIAAVRALWRCDDDASRTALRKLTTVQDQVVARHAKASLFLLSPTDSVEDDSAFMQAVGDRLAPMLRSVEGSEATIGLVETLMMAHPIHLADVLRRAVVVATTTAAVRRIAAKLAPGAALGSARIPVLEYLVRARDRDSLSEFRRSLDSASTYEIIAALKGIEAMRDTSARPAVDKLTRHADAEVAEAARRALSALDRP